MNSLADAAAQAAAAAAAAANPPPQTSFRPEGSTSGLDRSYSHPNFRSDPSYHASRPVEAPTSSTSDTSPPEDMNKASSDTPRRALLDSEKPEKRGSNLACLKCRAIKVKCSRANVDDERCKRCNRLDLVCEFKEHHRGRKPKKRARSDADSNGYDEEDQLEDEEAEAASFSANYNTSPARVKGRELSRSPSPPTPPIGHQHSYKRSESGRYEGIEPAPKLPSPKGSVHGRWFGPYLQPIPSFEDSLFSRKPLSHTGAPPHLQQQHDPSQQQSQHYQHQHQQSYHHDRSRDLPPISLPPAASSSRNGMSSTDHGSWDRTSAWTSAQSNLQRSSQPHASTSAPPTMATDLRDDAVRQHVISTDQAHELFDYFFAELNPPLALLDASLHTVEYCRQNAPILFSTIISVASRFFQPQLHRQCHRIAKSVLNLAAAEEICTLDHIQALICVITWKDPGDRTILRKANRAIGYAYELGLHASFDGLESLVASNKAARDSNEGNRARSDSYSQRYKRRLDRDRQRTWIVLCLIHELVREKCGRATKPRARIIPVEDYPDPYVWIRQAGDVLLSVDSRLAWSLDMSNVIVENEPFLDIINRSEDAAPFGGFFDRYRGRMDVLRKRYFDVREGIFHPRFPMDKSALAELPYLDAFRDFFICQSTWHWAAKVASSQRRTSRPEDTSRSTFWFNQTVDTTLRCMRLFVQDLCKPGYVRVGHDYLVITASEVTKWFFLYRDHLDPSTIVAGVEHLRATLRECGQPQRLGTGEVVDTEREAPGYFVRFLGAIFDAGLNESYEKAKAKLRGEVERLRSKVGKWGDAGDDGGQRRPAPWAGGSSSYQGGSAGDRTGSTTNVGGTSGSPTYRETVRYGLPRGRSEVGPTSRIAPSPSSATTTSFERASDKPPPAPTAGLFNPSEMGAPPTTFPTTSIAPAPHPAYLTSPSPSTITTTALNPTFSTWNPKYPAQMPADLAAGLTGEKSEGGIAGPRVVPLEAEMGKNSIEGLAACLNSRDLNYWSDILGFDLATPAV